MKYGVDELLGTPSKTVFEILETRFLFGYWFVDCETTTIVSAVVELTIDHILNFYKNRLVINNFILQIYINNSSNANIMSST